MKALASALLVAAALAAMMANDLLIRARGLNGEAGIDAGAWDTVGSLLLLVGAAGFVLSVWRDDK